MTKVEICSQEVPHSLCDLHKLVCSTDCCVQQHYIVKSIIEAIPQLDTKIYYSQISASDTKTQTTLIKCKDKIVSRHPNVGNYKNITMVHGQPSSKSFVKINTFCFSDL